MVNVCFSTAWDKLGVGERENCPHSPVGIEVSSVYDLMKFLTQLILGYRLL